MKKNFIKIILIILIVLTAGAGILGFIQSKKQTLTKEQDNKENFNKITYEYYFEDELVESMPINETPEVDENGNVSSTTEPTYLFFGSHCTNGVTGDFDTTSWKFIPSEEKESTCKLYFVKSSYSVTFTITNGILDDSSPKTIEREKDGKFIIKPNEGYTYKTYTCSNNKEGAWDESTNTFTINSVMADIACKIDFEIKNLQADITVVNGKGNSTEKANYGESINAVIEPNEGYQNPKIECTNNQNGIFGSNKFTIEKLTNDTKCTITFEKIPVVKHTLKIEIEDDTKFSISSGSESMSIEDGTTAVFAIKSLDGSTLSLNNIDCGGIKPSSIDSIDNSTAKFTFLNVTKDMTCKIK